MAHKNLASERVRIGMNQREAAEQFGVSMGTMVRYEADIDAASVEFIRRAADFFGCSAEYLMDLTEERLAR